MDCFRSNENGSVSYEKTAERELLPPLLLVGAFACLVSLLEFCLCLVNGPSMANARAPSLSRFLSPFALLLCLSSFFF
jgi:hypothetical protein